MGAEAQAVIHGTPAVLIQTRALLTLFGQCVVSGFTFFKQRSIQKMHRLLEHPRVAGDRDITTRGEREPQEIVGTPGAHTPP